MTDARFPERWLNDRRLLRLPDDAFRLFAIALMWSVANKTDGALYDDDLALIPAVDCGCLGQLAKAGLWRRNDDHWLIGEFEETQTTSVDLALMADKRRRARDKKRRQRTAASPGTSPGTQLGQDRPGQAGPKTEGQGLSSAAISQDRRDHDGPTEPADDDQHTPPDVHLPSPATGGNARGAPAARPCEHCGEPVSLDGLNKAQAAAARYCSPKHRTAAWHARRRAEGKRP